MELINDTGSLFLPFASNFNSTCSDVLTEHDALTWQLVIQAAAMTLARFISTFALAPYYVAAPILIFTWLSRSLPTYLAKREKRLPASIWTIHGKKYDLSSWAKYHPGGSLSIELGRNRDCTGLFESYHVFIERNKLYKMLARYEIKDEATSKEEPQTTLASLKTNSTGLTFGDGFHEDVKQMLRNYFMDGAKSHYMKGWCKCLWFLVFCLEIVTMFYFVKGYSLPLVVLPCLNWLLSCNVAHDGSHFAASKKPWVNRIAQCTSMPCFSPSLCWSIQHVVQHHVYTNDEDDVDLYHFLPVCRVTRLTKFAKVFKLQWVLVFWVLPTSVAHLLYVVPMDLLSGCVDAVTGTRRYQQCENLEDLVERNQHVIWTELLLCLSWVAVNLSYSGVMTGLWRVYVSYSLASYIFVIFTQGAHLQEKCMVGKDDPSWAKRQARTSVNFGAKSQFWNLCSGGLNLQSIHHVVPIIGSCHLVELYPRFKKVCAKHNVSLHETNLLGFFGGFVMWIRELASEGDEQIKTSFATDCFSATVNKD